MAEVAGRQELREILDAAIRGKEIATHFFASLATSVDDVFLRRCFQRLSQEEWDHRKILLKHRRELFGRNIEGIRGAGREAAEAFSPMVGKPPIRSSEDLRVALRTAIRTEREVHRFFTEASRNFDDRAVKVFLRILAEEGLAQIVHLQEALAAVDSGIGGPRRRRSVRTGARVRQN